CIDLLAIEDDEAFDEAVWLARQGDTVEIAAGSEEGHLSVVHDSHRNKIRSHLRHCSVDLLDADGADDVAVPVRLENICLTQRGDAVDQHPPRRRIDDAVRQPGLVTGAAGDYIAALLDKEIGPVFEPVLVDAVDIGGDQLLNTEPDGDLVHVARQLPVSERYSFQKPRIAASLARKGCGSASYPPIMTTPVSSSLYR